MRGLALAALIPALAAGAQPRWWMDEPVRLIQTNLRETDATLDAARLIRQVAEFPANTLLFGMGGIVAYYPTRAPFHYPSPYLPAGRDLFGEVLREAHARHIRVIGRFDFSKTQKAVYDAHPEWFIRKTNGAPVIYNGLYSACINGGYYHEQALRILEEALDRYDVDGLFFNMFGNPATDYSGNPIGPCHCRSCEERFRARYHREIPATPDTEYREFLADSAREVGREIGALIHRRRPRAGFFTYIQQFTDGIMSESNTAVGRPLPLWPYSASDNVNRARNSEPDKMAVNLCMSFVDFPWRFVTVPSAEIRLRLYENMANGGALALNMHGTMEQEDGSALIAARPVYEWHARHEDLYVGQESAARVLLLGGRGSAYRGFFRFLSEQHIPFAVADNARRLASYELVIAPEGVPPEAEAYVREGGHLLVAGTSPPAFAVGQPVRRWPRTQAYFRVRDRAAFPSLRDTSLILLDGEYVEFPPAAHALLTLIPPARFGPPELVWTDKVETDKPGLLWADYGKGRVAYLPWDIGSLYYRLSSQGHAGLLADVVDAILPHGRQLKTNAHPLVEITLMRQPKQGCTLVHFVNLTGHADTAYFEPVEMRNIEVTVEGSYHSARSVRLGRELAISGGRFVLPSLGAYDVVVLH